MWCRQRRFMSAPSEAHEAGKAVGFACFEVVNNASRLRLLRSTGLTGRLVLHEAHEPGKASRSTAVSFVRDLQLSRAWLVADHSAVDEGACHAEHRLLSERPLQAGAKAEVGISCRAHVVVVNPTVTRREPREAGLLKDPEAVRLVPRLAASVGAIRIESLFDLSAHIS